MTGSAPERPPVAPSYALDHPAWASLTGLHVGFALGGGLARRYRAEVSPFAALADLRDPAAWAALHALYAPDEVAVLAGPAGFTTNLPRGWAWESVVAGVQLVATPALRSGPDDEAVVLGAADAAEAVDLVERTEPGPFRRRTLELGTYLGIRRGGRLVAMAGERFHPTGFTEISAVCTDPGFRRQGLAARLVRALADRIRNRDEVPFLHTGAANEPAIRLYRAMGFTLRSELEFAALRRLG